jgi:hypothetical protein
LLHLVGDLFELYDDARTYKTLKLMVIFTAQERNAVIIIREWDAGAYSRTHTGVTLQD